LGTTKQFATFFKNTGLVITWNEDNLEAFQDKWHHLEVPNWINCKLDTIQKWRWILFTTLRPDCPNYHGDCQDDAVYEKRLREFYCLRELHTQLEINRVVMEMKPGKSYLDGKTLHCLNTEIISDAEYTGSSVGRKDPPNRSYIEIASVMNVFDRMELLRIGGWTKGLEIVWSSDPIPDKPPGNDISTSDSLDRHVSTSTTSGSSVGTRKREVRGQRECRSCRGKGVDKCPCTTLSEEYDSKTKTRTRICKVCQNSKSRKCPSCQGKGTELHVYDEVY
jgi:hypothetical protein